MSPILSKKFAIIAALVIAVLVVVTFLRLTHESPFEFTDKALYRPLVQFASPKFKATEARLLEIDSRLAELPVPTTPPTGGTSGYTTGHNATEAPWIHFNFTNPVQLDAIAVIPAQRPESLNQILALNLPSQIECRFILNDSEQKSVLFSIGTKTHLRGTLPLYAEFSPLIVDRVEILIPPGLDETHSMALGEVLLFNDWQNVAMDAQLSSSSSQEGLAGFALDFLCDGQTPLGLPQIDELHPFVGYRSPPYETPYQPLSISIRWEEAQEIDEVLLFPTERLLGVQANTAGFPRRIQLETRHSENAAWEPVHTTPDLKLESTGLNPASIRFASRSCQAIRIVTTELWQLEGSPAILSLAEIQARHQGIPIQAQPTLLTNHATQQTSARPKNNLERHWKLTALTDGMSTEGRILHERTWLAALAERAERLVEQDTLRTALEPMRAKANRLCGRITIGLPLLVLAAALAYVAYTQVRYRRDLRRVRNQLAADLHDDLGSNLSAITTFADQSRRQFQKEIPQEQFPWQYAYMERLVRESIGSLKDLISVTAPQITKHVPLIERLREVADIHRAGLPLDFQVSPELESIELPQPQRRTLRLFLKEAFNNILRHSKADWIEVRIENSTTGKTWMHIRDNGCGMNEKQLNWLRESSTLRMRAEDNQADFTVRQTDEGGTEVSVSISQPSHRDVLKS